MRRHLDALPPSLKEAYQKTDYVVLEGRREVAAMIIGAKCPPVDRLLRLKGANRGAFVTAWNPWSRSRSPAENERANRRLERLLKRRRLAYLHGEGRPLEGAWKPEASLFVFGLTCRDAGILSRRLRQNAVVFIRRGGKARLLPTR
ncbi:DUF3293 domain-containing protein [Azospirillum sp. SYSU D00513]|uniref:DUF3293 domain-containing protein n=1 Tax=Azospirillum sp. SYSU D00513 TaxID=2812561 RepID=UPI001A95EBC1|nr:DUF3293 domain-containing protein [Azospirillum sp. SYSU D00513]